MGAGALRGKRDDHQQHDGRRLRQTAAARDALYLAEERYKVGAATFVDVTDARAAYERAENDRIGAVYDYHKAFAALENAVGRPLR